MKGSGNTKSIVRAIWLVVLALSWLAIDARGARAECDAAGCHDEQVTRLYVEQGMVRFRISSEPQVDAVLNCSPVAGVYLALPPSTGNFREMYAILLTASLTGRLIDFGIYPNSPCNIAYLVLK